MLPNTFLIGAAKCATTSISRWLSQNREVCLSYGKENYFYSRDYINGFEWYRKNFLEHYVNEKNVLDATATNQVLHFEIGRASCRERV